MSDDTDDGEKTGFFRQYGLALGVATLVGGAVAFVAMKMSGGEKPVPKKSAEVTMVRLAPLPQPPPPPPPPPKNEPEEKKPETEPTPTDREFVAQEPVAKTEEPPAAPAPAEEAIGTSLKGDGANNFGLGFSRTGGGNAAPGTLGGNGTGGTGTGSGFSKYGRYAVTVQNKVREALLGNKKTRSAAIAITVRLWADAAGRIVRAELAKGTGDADLDAAIRGEVLAGMPLGEAPPADMPMPIVMRISGSRPQ